MAKAPKRTFLTVYDYGMGGVWSFIDAESGEAIEKRFPELKVVAERPAWMTDEIVRTIEQSRHFDIDAPAGWLLNLTQRS
jgi:hypothetical protein